MVPLLPACLPTMVPLCLPACPLYFSAWPVCLSCFAHLTPLAILAPRLDPAVHSSTPKPVQVVPNHKTLFHVPMVHCTISGFTPQSIAQDQAVQYWFHTIQYLTWPNLMYIHPYISSDHNILDIAISYNTNPYLTTQLCTSIANLKYISVFVACLGIRGRQSNRPKVQTRVTLLWLLPWLWNPNSGQSSLQLP